MLQGGETVAALDWLVTAGLDVPVTDSPRSWLAPMPAPEAAMPGPPTIAAATRPSLPTASPALTPDAAVDLSHLADLPSLLAAVAALDHPLRRPDAAPQFVTGAVASGTLVIVDQADPDDSDASRLATRMLAAIGLAADNHARAHMLPWPVGRAPRDAELAAFAPYLCRAVDFIAPTRILAFGDRAAALSGVAGGVSRLRGRWLDFRGRPLLATFHPRFLLGHPELKGLAWADLQTFAEGH